MSNKLLMGLSSLLLPLGLYGVPAQSSTSYQRSYLSASINNSPDLSATSMAATHIVRDAVPVAADELAIVSASPVKELVIIDAAVPDKATFYRGVKPGVDIVEINSSQPGLPQLKQILASYKNLTALHIVSHATAGELHLGNSKVNAALLKQEIDTFAALKNALVDGADLLLYGCDLASGESGEELLDIIRSHTGLDVAASTNKTGSAESGGDWDLEIQQGDIQSTLAFSPKALADFSGVLAPETYGASQFPLDQYQTSLLSNDNDFALTGSETSVYAGAFGSRLYLDSNAYPAPTSGFLQLAAANTLASFELTALNVKPSRGGTPNLSCALANVTGYLASSGQVTATFAIGDSEDSIAVPLTAFSGQQITRFKVTAVGCTNAVHSLQIQNFTVDNKTRAGANNAPVISNLDGDSVAWPGVGNTVTLDVGGNATVADNELDAANWGGASLTVQRNLGGTNTPISSDFFSFNASGYSVSGSNLQTGGSTTFGTFTNTNGVLTISFNANATNSLVRDVMRGIQYRNDTPAGDATIRFALSDGTASTTADVTVTSDSIYVTNTSDTATIDVTNGVSFSEAVAIAAADVTGSQTIVFDGTLASTTLIISSVALSESLTFNTDSATGITLSGGAFTLNAGTTLTFTNGSGDTATLTNNVISTGGLTKTGAGSLTLSGNNSYTGGTTISAGTLSISNGTALQNFSDVNIASGATLALNSNEAIGTLSGAGQINLGSATLTSNISANSTFSGNISGTGGLTLGQIGAATYSLTLSGNNSYTGATILSNYAWLRLDGENSLSSSTALRVNGNSVATLLSDQTLGSLASSSSTASIQLGSFTMTAGGDNTSTTTSGVISGTGNLVKQGSGTLTLAGSNTYTGQTTVSAGSLSIATDSNLGGGAVNLAGGTTLNVTGATNIDNSISLSGNSTINNAGSLTLSGVVSGANTLTKSGAGTLTLSGSNSYSGTAVNAGTLSVAGDANLGSGVITLNDGTLAITSAGTIDNAITLANDGTLNLAAATSFTGQLSGEYRLAKYGVGDMIVANSNNTNMTGEIAVFEANLLVADGSYMPSTVVLRGGNLIFTDATTVSSVVAVQADAFISNNNNVTLNNVIELGDSNHTLTKAGAGRLTLTSTANSQFMAGKLVVEEGVLSVSDDRHLNSGDTTINGGTLAITATGIYDNNIVIGASNAMIDVSNSVTATLSGGITGVGGLGKTGAGSLRLAGAGSFTGATNVSGGTLVVNNVLSGTSLVTVASGATITGSGSVPNLLVNGGGTFSPGTSPGTFTVNGNLQMNSGSTLAVEINGATAGTEHDQIVVNGSVDVSGAALSATHGYTAGQGDDYTIIINDAADAITGTFSGLAEGATTTAGGNGTVLTASYIGGTGNDFTLAAPLNAAPVIANLNGDSVSFIEDSDLILLDAGSDATVTDSDSTDFDGGNVTVSITANRLATEDVLSIRNEGTAGGQIGTSGSNITYGGTLIGTRTADGGTDINDLVITLNSAATPAIVQALVRNLTYTNTNTTTPGTNVRTVRVTVNDGNGGTSSSADIAVAVVATNDAPTLIATGATPTFTEGGAAVGLFSGTSISTVESGQLITMLTVTVSNATDGSDEILYFDGSDIPLINGFTGTSLIHGVDISVVVTGSTATLTLVRTGGLSSAQTLVDGMTYRNNSSTPTMANRVITITALQDNGGTANGGEDTSSPNVSATVTLSGVNSIPVVTTSAGVTAFIEGNNVASTPVVIDGDITVSDLDNATLTSATASITANFQAAEDVLAFTNDGSTMGNITASYNSSTGVLTLTSIGATATLAEWEAALAAVTYTNNSETPSESARETSFVVNDGVDASVASTKSVSVTAVNDTPVISGAPALSINQGIAYSFTPSVSDSDTIVFLFSIANQPAWAVFDPVTGTLSGTPTNTNVGTTAGIVITVSDGTTSTSLPGFNLTVVNVNGAPVINSNAITTATQDVAYSYTFAAVDSDAGDVLTLSAPTLPSWLSFNPATGLLSGIPTNANVGSHAVMLRATDVDGLSVDQSFSITVANVNDAPTITGTPTTSVDQDVAYSFTPTASDVDVGDVLTYSITNRPTWAAFDTATGALTGTPINADVGTTSGIVITVSDGVLSASLPAFNLEVIETIDPLQPVVTAPEDIAINATGLYTPVSLRQLLSLNASATQEQVDAILNSMASDGVSGNTCCTTNPEGLNVNNALLLPPGRHEVTWKATNAAGVSGTATQVVSINPLVSLSKSQVTVRGNDVSFRVLLNGRAPVYPLNIPYVIDSSTTATSAEHNLVSGIASFTQEGQMEVVVPVSLADVTEFSDSQLVIALGEGINLGATNRHVIEIKSGNVPPVVKLSITQGGIDTSLITASGGPVTITATVFDANKTDTHSFDWSATSGLADTDGNPVDAVRVIDPTGLSGTRQVNVTVTDSAGSSVLVSVYFRVAASLPVLQPDTDADGDGLDDLLEGTGDADDNGIPDYLDNMPSPNILPQQGNTTNAFLIECDPGVRCGLGLFARSGASGGAQVLDQEIGQLDNLIIDPAFEPVGGVFDFAIRDLPTPGQSVRVVIPQRSAIPANAVYRKYQSGRWVTFIADADNAVHSAAGNPGYCPPPGAADWVPGLTAGHLCVQLTIEDGGPNDDDGLVNSAVVDPGAVSTALPVEPPPPPPPAPDVTVKSKGGGAVNGLWFLLLGSLLMMKWFTGKNRRALIALALIATSASTQALTDGKAFVRVDLINVEGDQSEAMFTQSLGAAGHAFAVDKYDVDRRGYQIALGYQWHDYTYSELGYLELGDVTVDMTLDGDTDLTAFKRDFANAYPVSASGWTVVQGLTLLRDQPVTISLEAGAYLWQDEKETNQQTITLQSDSGVAPLAGIRLDLGLTERLSYGVSARRIYLADQVVDLYSLSGRFRF
uniref:DUF4347 domain-containing protein n=1 Tax=Cellvibrio fontiphilus TaxID=1815559 RepID=UPI002B4BEF82|nr:DUF4347 domain-containing protein [Cellvibrio fontiphilus]